MKRRPDPDDEWQRWANWLTDTPGKASIWEDVIGMVAARQIWDSFRLVHNHAPSDAKSSGIFMSWVSQAYAQRQGLAIRRQADIDRDVVSLGHLIDRVRRYPDVLSRARYLTQVSDHSDPADANAYFDALVGAGRDHIDKLVPKADLATLRTRTKKIVMWVDNEVAHYNQSKGDFSVGIKFADLHASVDIVLNLFVKYHELILGSSVARTVSMPPWIHIFKTQWIADDDHMTTVYQHISEIEKKRDRSEALSPDE